VVTSLIKPPDPPYNAREQATAHQRGLRRCGDPAVPETSIFQRHGIQERSVASCAASRCRVPLRDTATRQVVRCTTWTSHCPASFGGTTSWETIL